MFTLYEIKDNRIHFVYCSLLFVYIILSTIAFGNKENFSKTNYFEYWISTYSLIIFFAIISFFFFNNSFYSIWYMMTIILLFTILTIQIFLVIENEKEKEVEDVKKREDRKLKLILNSINLSIVFVILILFIMSFIYNKKELVNELFNVAEMPPLSTPTTEGKDLGLLGSSYVLSNPYDDYDDNKPKSSVNI
jgi:magnesium-transporting ATPase (P-type)